MYFAFPIQILCFYLFDKQLTRTMWELNNIFFFLYPEIHVCFALQETQFESIINIFIYIKFIRRKYNYSIIYVVKSKQSSFNAAWTTRKPLIKI